MNTPVSRKIIIDQPVDQDAFHGKGHERTATSLAEAIAKFRDGDHAIGLDGPWGSGKSSVVAMAEARLDKAEGLSKEGVTYHFFTFDIWKSQGSDFRRSFLEHLLSWGMATFPNQHPKLEKIRENVQGKTREIETNNHPILGWYGIIVLALLPFLPIYYFWAKSVYNSLSKHGQATDFLYSLPLWILLVFVFGSFLLAYCKRPKDKQNQKIDFKTSVSRMLLISSRQHQDHKITQKVREIDPNDYEFHSTLREILSVIQSSSARVVLVLDNIDRLPRKEIKEYWALVRSIFARGADGIEGGGDRTILAIVPYDRILIESNLEETNGSEASTLNGDDVALSRGSLTALSSRELFSKTFDVVLNVAPPVLSNAREFFESRIGEALGAQATEDEVFRSYRIFCELLSVQGGTTTPRQIVSFINDLSGLFVLHEGLYRLPTLAAFLAHQDSLSRNPLILTHSEGLNGKIAELADDPELTRNLAAIVFNVERDLAFQILLDGRLVEASIANSPDGLIELSKAPGFDLRVDDVVSYNISGWTKTRDILRVIDNYVALARDYNAPAKTHVSSTLINGVLASAELSAVSGSHTPYLKLLHLGNEEQKARLLEWIVKGSLEALANIEQLSSTHGADFAVLLKDCAEAAGEHGLGAKFKAIISRASPPSDADFMLSLAKVIAVSGFSLNDFGDPDIILPEDVDFFGEAVIEDPVTALVAFGQMEEAGLLTAKNWLGIIKAALDGASSQELEDGGSAELLEVASYGWTRLSPQKRKEIDMASVSASGSFFRNLGDNESLESQKAHAHAFLLYQGQLGETVPTPSVMNPQNQKVADGSDGLTAFNEMLSGEVELTEHQIPIIRERIVEAPAMTAWITHSAANPDHAAVRQMVVAICTREVAPRINFNTILTNFAHLLDVLGDTDTVDFLSRFARNVEEKQVAEIELKSVPTQLIRLSHQAEGPCWDSLHSRLDDLFRSIDANAWAEHLGTMDLTTQKLIAKIDSSGCSLGSERFREPLFKLIDKIFSGDESVDGQEGAVDTLLRAVDHGFLPDVWRRIRESINGMTSTSLVAAMRLCPEFVRDLTHAGERISKSEKDRVVREILCPALEGRHRKVLGFFVDLGSTRMGHFRKAMEPSTSTRLNAAWKDFSNAEEDRAFIETVGEAIWGKRKAKGLLATFFGSG